MFSLVTITRCGKHLNFPGGSTGLGEPGYFVAWFGGNALHDSPVMTATVVLRDDLLDEYVEAHGSEGIVSREPWEGWRQPVADAPTAMWWRRASEPTPEPAPGLICGDGHRADWWEVTSDMPARTDAQLHGWFRPGWMPTPVDGAGRAWEWARVKGLIPVNPNGFGSLIWSPSGVPWAAWRAVGVVPTNFDPHASDRPWW